MGILLNHLQLYPLHINPIEWLYNLVINETQGKYMNGIFTGLLRAILNGSWNQHTIEKLYGYFPPITQTIQGRTRAHGHTSVSQREKT